MAKKIFWIALLALWAPSEAARAGFGFHAGTHLDFGEMASATQSLIPRTTTTYDIQFMPGYRPLPILLTGLMLNYRMVKQNPEPENAGNTEVTGYSFLVGPGVSVEPGSWKFLLAYDIKATHTSPFYNTRTTYKGHAVQFTLAYEISQEVHFEFQYVKCTYNARFVNGRYTDIDYSRDLVTHTNAGFGISYSY